MKSPAIVILLIISFFSTPALQAKVTLTQSTFKWKVYNHSINADHSLSHGPDYNSIIDKDFKSYILENEFLKITLVPEFGGRIVSMIYKPTGHEELYHPQTGHPQGHGDGSFYFDWLMVLGGINPTFSTAEHGKFWFLPWKTEIVKETDSCVSIQMSQVDTIDFSKRPQRFGSYVKTGITCDFIVSLSDGKASTDIKVILTNPGSNSQPYEYWTCTAMAPGSNPADPRITGNAELHIPVDKVRIVDDWCQTIKTIDPSLGNNFYTFNKLRYFKNWTDMGIAYAPEDFALNYWGVINHDDNRNEGLIRVSENKETKGVKIWSWQYQTAISNNPLKNGLMHQPFFEVWGGTTDRFFKQVQLAAGATKEWVEYYSPIVGIDSITHASKDVILKCKTNKKSYDGKSDTNLIVTCNLFSIVPHDGVILRLQFQGANTEYLAYTKEITPDMTNGNSVEIKIPCSEIYNGFTGVHLVVTNSKKYELIKVTINGLQFVNCSELPFSAINAFNNHGVQNAHLKNYPAQVYTTSGRRVETKSSKNIQNMLLPQGVYFVRSRNGTIEKVIQTK